MILPPDPAALFLAEQPDLNGLRAFLFITDMKQNLLPFSQVMNTAIAQGAQMHKHISFICADIHKPISFIGVEELHHPFDLILAQLGINRD